MYFPASNGRLNSKISSAFTPLTFDPIGRHSDLASATIREARGGVEVVWAGEGVLVGTLFTVVARRRHVVCMFRSVCGVRGAREGPARGIRAKRRIVGRDMLNASGTSNNKSSLKFQESKSLQSSLNWGQHHDPLHGRWAIIRTNAGHPRTPCPKAGKEHNKDICIELETRPLLRHPPVNPIR